MMSICLVAADVASDQVAPAAVTDNQLTSLNELYQTTLVPVSSFIVIVVVVWHTRTQHFETNCRRIWYDDLSRLDREYMGSTPPNPEGPGRA